MNIGLLSYPTRAGSLPSSYSCRIESHCSCCMRGIILKKEQRSKVKAKCAWQAIVKYM